MASVFFCDQDEENIFVFGQYDIAPVVVYVARIFNNYERPNTASSPTAPGAPAGDDEGDSRRGGLCLDC